MTRTITLHEQAFILHPSGAVYWPGQKLLLISDVHLGKVMHFRRHGVALPPDSAQYNFQQLSAVADHFRPETICFLGDLFHSRINSEWPLFEAWVRGRTERLVLVSGNHDIIPAKRYAAIGTDVLPEWEIPPFLLTHEPENRAGLFTLCGHVHPAVRLRGTARQWLKLPCFFQSERQLILPAFGEFTGTHVLRQSDGDTVYVIADGQVLLPGE